MVRFTTLATLLLIQGLLLTQIFATETFRIVFLDVGQGDAIYIQSPNGNDMLIDGGATERVLRELSKTTSFFNRDIDVVVGTHPDKDHIGGLISVFDRYAVTHYIDPGTTHDTTAYQQLLGRVEKEAVYTVARTGMKIDLGSDVTAHILFPDREVQGGVNNTSVVMRISYGDTHMLLTGDAGKGIERHLVKTETIQSDLLKVGHHGSKTSTDEAFVRAVDPAYAIVSAGEDNQYGHPHTEVLETLRAANVKILGTYEEGSITFVSDGKELKQR